jgi:hypothetical protein
MKWISFFAITCFILLACSERNKNKNSRVAPTGTGTESGPGRAGDTASYERMPQQLTDSTRK